MTRTNRPGEPAEQPGEQSVGQPAQPAVLDARGQRCPLPVIRLGAFLKDLPVRTTVRLLATDPAARSDVPAFCRMRRHDLLEVIHEAEHTAYLVRKGA